MYYKILENIKYLKTEKFNIKQNGIQIIEDENKIEIYNDPFRTIPLFVTKNQNNKIILFSNFEDFYALENIDESIDEIGFWEVILFGSGLWDRTLYKNVKQMPAASKIIINKNTSEYDIIRYWHFDIKEDKNIDSIEKAAEGLFNRLDSIFSKLDREKKYVMGISGGMDSRITLAFLSKYIPKENLELFTYGFDDRLLEYKYACEIASALGYNKPKFHKLSIESYIKAMDYLPQETGGQIGINHSHILDYTRNTKLNTHLQISNYFSDALFGFDCTSPKKTENISNNYYSEIIQNVNYLNTEIKEEMIKDANKIFMGFNNQSNFSSISEYKYLTERNQKFHSHLSYVQNSYLVLADFDLLTYMVAMPIKYREQKKLIDFILDNYFEEVSTNKFKNISSRDFNGVSPGFTIDNKIEGLIEWYNFKFINRANAILRVVTKGYIQLFNKFQTEEQERLLYRDLHKELKESTAKFVKLKLMTTEQKLQWDKLPIRSNGINERYCLISLSKLVKG